MTYQPDVAAIAEQINKRLDAQDSAISEHMSGVAGKIAAVTKRMDALDKTPRTPPNG